MHRDQLPGSFFGPSTLVELLRHRAEHQGDDRGFSYLVDGESESVHLTYSELDRKARAIGAWLSWMGLEGKRALLLYPAGLDFIAAFFGCMYAGVVAVPAYPPRRNRKLSRIQAIARDAEASVALTTAQALEIVQPVLNQTPDLQKLRWMPTDHLPEGAEDQWKKPDVHGDTLAFLQYTSGSTGDPKGVILTHANLIHNSAMISYAFENTRSAVGVFWLPSYHDMGLIGGILQPLYMGQINILMSPASFLQRPYRWLSAISKFRGAISGGPNFAYDLCVRKITAEQREKLDLSSWTLAFNGAEPVRASTLERFAETFAPCGFRYESFYPCYGMAEATLIVSGGYKVNPPLVRSFDMKAIEAHKVVEATGETNGSRKLVGNGGNLLDQKIVIVDPERSRRCSPNEVGEIWVAGPSVAQGYWKRPEETEEAFQACLEDNGEGPFLRTGDLGFLNNGELFVTGRMKDLIILRGVNHYPQDIELTVEKSHGRLLPHSGAVFTVEVDGQERLVVVHEVRRRGKVDTEEILEAIRREVGAEHEIVVEAVVLIKANSIPKTSSGKIQRHVCRDSFLDNSLNVVYQWCSFSEPMPSEEATPEVVQNAAETDERSVVSESEVTQKIDSDPPRTTGVEFSESKKQPVPAAKHFDTAEIVLEHVRFIAKDRANNLSMDAPFVELGLDSLERMEIVTLLEETYGARFPEEVLSQLETCQDLVHAAETYLGGVPKQRSLSESTNRASATEIGSETYRFDQFPEYAQLKQNIQFLSETGKNPYFHVHQRVTNDTALIDGREMINFSSFNYLGMSGDPVVAEAAKRAIDQFGTSVSASRLVSGEKTIHRELERAIADFVGTQDAIVFVSGHGTNETTLGHLFGPGDLILHDELAHNSIIQGCLLSGASRRPFPHNDWRTLDQLLAQMRYEYRRVVIAIEGIYSMDGDFPNLPRFIEVKKAHKALLMIDEAHSIGVMGPHGRGLGEYFQIDTHDVDLWMGTLSKSFGSCGGYIAGCKEVVEYLKYTAPGFVYSVGISPSSVAAALAAMNLLEEEPERVACLAKRSKLFLKLSKERGLDTGMSKESPIVPVIVGDSTNALRLSNAMYQRGINVQPILYPAVPESAARLRFFITSDHSEQQIRKTVDAVAEELHKIAPAYFQRAVGVAQKSDRHPSSESSVRPR